MNVDATGVLIQILREPEFRNALDIFCRWLASQYPGCKPKVFLTSTHSAQAELLFPIGHISETPTGVEAQRQRIASRRPGDGILGYLEVEASAPIESDLVEAVIDELYRRKYVSQFLVEIKRPLDFTSQDTYFAATAKLLSNALSMQMVAIRQLNATNSLNCRAFYRHPNTALLGYDFDGENLPAPFREIVDQTHDYIASKKTANLPIAFEEVPENPGERYQFLEQLPELAAVRAFAIFPIVIGDDFFGVVSCSTTSNLGFSSLERATISTAMQLISISISNFIQFHETRRMTENLHDHLFSATEIEIAQSARHELQNIEAEQVLQLDELSSIVKHVREKEIAPVVVKLRGSIDKLDRAISKLRYSAVHASPVSTHTSVQVVWEEALNLMIERLRMEQIRARYVGQPLEGMYYADWLREAFLNLLLNSIDAFRDRPKQNRFVALVVQKESEASQYHVLDYSDNAGGVAFSKLVVPEPVRASNPGMSDDEILFQPKVTSKRRNKGAGWGLYLVRQALRLHEGSISLKSSSREGSTFRIQLKKSAAGDDRRTNKK